MSSKTQEFSKQAERASNEVQQATEVIRTEHITKIEMLNKSHVSELNELREQLNDSQIKMREFSAEAERAAKEVQNATNAIREEHSNKIDLLSRAHISESDDLRAQIAALQVKVQDHSAEAGRASSETQLATDAIRLEHAKNMERLSKKHATHLEEAVKEHTGELEKLRKQLADSQSTAQDLGREVDRARTEVQQAKDSLQREYGSKIDALSASHDEVLQKLRSQLTQSQDELEKVTIQSITDIEEARQIARNESSQDAAKTLEAQKEKHEAMLQALHERLTSFERDGADSASKVQQLLAQIANLTEESQKERKYYQTQLEKVSKEHESTLVEKQEALAQLKTVKKEHESLAAEKVEILANLSKVKQEHESLVGQNRKSLKVKDEEIARGQEKLEEFRAAHSHELKDLQISHHQELDQLRTAHGLELAKSETAARERLQSIESDYAMSKDQLSEMERKVVALSESHKEALETKDQEVASVAHVIESLQDQIQEMQQSKTREVEAAVLRVKQDHERIIAQINEKAEAAQKALEKVLETRQTDHENEIKKLRQQIGSSEEIQERAMKELAASRDEALELIKALQKDIDDGLESRLLLKKALEDTSSEVSTLKMALETLDKNTVSKDDEHRLALKKANDELENTTKSLQVKAAEYTTLCEQHVKEKEIMKADLIQRGENASEELRKSHDALLQASKEASESHTSQLEALRAEFSRRTEEAQRLSESRIRELETRLTEKQSQTLENGANGAETNTISHAEHLKVIGDLQSQHQSILENTKTVHEAAMAELREQASKSRSLISDGETQSLHKEGAETTNPGPETSTSEAEPNDLMVQLAQAKAEIAATKMENANLRRQKMQIEALRRQYSADDKDLRAALATDREALNDLAAAAEEVGQIMIDPAELERLKTELSGLSEKHAAELAKIHESISIESERRDKERKQGAETRDRLAAELSMMNSQISAKDAEIESLRSVVELARKEMQDSNTRLEQARAASSEQEARHREESAELDNIKAELEIMKQNAATTTKGHARHKSSHTQELDALQTIAGKERARAEQLRQELDDALGASDRYATRLREVEAALKVTTAELTETKTWRADGSDFTISTPIPKQGLRTSRFSVDAKEFTPAAVREALAKSANRDSNSPKRKEAGLGAHIEGMVGSPSVYYFFS